MCESHLLGSLQIKSAKKRSHINLIIRKDIAKTIMRQNYDILLAFFPQKSNSMHTTEKTKGEISSSFKNKNYTKNNYTLHICFTKLNNMNKWV